MSEQAEIAAMERRLAVLGHVVVDYDRYNAMHRDSEIVKRARRLAHEIKRRRAMSPYWEMQIPVLLDLLTGDDE